MYDNLVMKNIEKNIEKKTELQHNEPAEELKAYPALAAARDYGVDIQMLLDNLKRPVSERIRRHNIALQTIKKLQNNVIQ